MFKGIKLFFWLEDSKKRIFLVWLMIRLGFDSFWLQRAGPPPKNLEESYNIGAKNVLGKFCLNIVHQGLCAPPWTSLAEGDAPPPELPRRGQTVGGSAFPPRTPGGRHHTHPRARHAMHATICFDKILLNDTLLCKISFYTIFEKCTNFSFTKILFYDWIYVFTSL